MPSGAGGGGELGKSRCKQAGNLPPFSWTKIKNKGSLFNNRSCEGMWARALLSHNFHKNISEVKDLHFSWFNIHCTFLKLEF